MAVLWIQKGDPHSLLVRTVRDKAARLAEMGTHLRLQWVPGHIGLKGKSRQMSSLPYAPELPPSPMVVQAAEDDAHLLIQWHAQVQQYVRPLDRHHHLCGPHGCRVSSSRLSCTSTLRWTALPVSTTRPASTAGQPPRPLRS